MIIRCLRQHFSVVDMIYPLKLEAEIVGHLDGSDPSVVADKLYDLAKFEGKIDNLVEAMLAFAGREAAVRSCIESQLSKLA